MSRTWTSFRPVNRIYVWGARIIWIGVPVGLLCFWFYRFCVEPYIFPTTTSRVLASAYYYWSDVFSGLFFWLILLVPVSLFTAGLIRLAWFVAWAAAWDLFRSESRVSRRITAPSLALIIGFLTIFHSHGRLELALTGDCQRCNLKGADLRDADLAGSNLTGANLTGANLTGANLTGANLQPTPPLMANFRSATSTSASLRGANLSNARLDGAYLRGVDLTNANLSGASLQEMYDYDRRNVRRSNFYCNTTMPDGTVNNTDCESRRQQCARLQILTPSGDCSEDD